MSFDRPTLLALILAAAPALAAVPARAETASPAPCLQSTAACRQWIPLGKGEARGMIYATYALDRPNPAIRRALIMVHGTLRNPDHYFTTATGAAFLAGALGDTLVIAPAFHATSAWQILSAMSPGSGLPVITTY